MSRLSPCLVSAICAAVSSVPVRFFVIGVAFGLVAFSVVLSSFFILAFGIGSFSGCGGCGASVFSFVVRLWVLVCAAVSRMRFLPGGVIPRPLF